jgi:hypothetical protein
VITAIGVSVAAAATCILKRTDTRPETRRGDVDTGGGAPDAR